MGDVQLDPRQGESGVNGDFKQVVPDPWDGAAGGASENGSRAGDQRG